MDRDSLAAACGLYCGFCRFYMNEECRGCGSKDRSECKIFTCCRAKKRLYFCTECDSFPCTELQNSIGLHPEWLKALAEQPLRKRGATPT